MIDALQIIIGAIVGFSIALAPFTKSILVYLKPTIEGPDGKASMKRITVLLFVILFTVGFFADLLFDLSVDESYLTLIATLVLGGIGLTSGQSLASDYLRKGKEKESSQTPANEAEEGNFTPKNEGNFQTR